MKEPIRIELPTFFGMKTVNCYLLKDPVPTLIDCGESVPAVWNALTTGLKDNGLAINDIERLVITHAHVDHMGSAAKIAEEANAKIWVTDMVKDWAVNLVEMWDKRETIILNTLHQYLGKAAFGHVSNLITTMSDMTKKAWPSVPSSSLHIFQQEGEIELGGSIWQTLHVPGHSANQSCFFNPLNGQLLSADMLLKVTPTPVIDIKPGSDQVREKAIFKLLDSYRKIRLLDIDKVFPGHYEVFENAAQTIDHQVKRIHLRKEECYKIIVGGTSSFWEIGKMMYGSDLHLPAINMMVGYLDLLEAEGRIFYGDETEKGMQIFVKK